MIFSPFETLLSDLIALLPLDVHAVLNQHDGDFVTHFELQDSSFRMMCPEGADTFTIYCELDKFDPARDAAITTRLLELNLVLAATGLGGLGFERQSDRLVHAVPASTRMDAADLLDALHRMAQQAARWRAECFTFSATFSPDAARLAHSERIGREASP